MPRLSVPRLGGRRTGRNDLAAKLRRDLARMTVERDDWRKKATTKQDELDATAEAPPCPDYAAMGVTDPTLLASLQHLWAVTHTKRA